MSPPGSPSELVVELWWASLDLGDDDLAELTAALHPAERARAAALRDGRERRRWLADHGWRRRLLGRRSGRDPREIAYRIEEHGKPRIDGGGPHFSASRAGATALYAVCESAEVGVDVEAVSGRADLQRLAGRLLSPSERAVYAELAPSERGEALAACWTRKEAYLKARGTGLVFPLGELELWIGDDRPVRRHGIEVHAVAPAPPGLASAVAVTVGSAPTVAIGAAAELRR